MIVRLAAMELATPAGACCRTQTICRLHGCTKAVLADGTGVEGVCLELPQTWLACAQPGAL